jgi:hypothetical protein
MSQRVEFENIEEMRRNAGIDDVELREAIEHLQVGDWVRVTLQVAPGAFPGESLIVRITSIKGGVFRGKLARPGRCPRRAHLTPESLLTFTGAHIHSIPKKRSGLAPS